MAHDRGSQRRLAVGRGELVPNWLAELSSGIEINQLPVPMDPDDIVGLDVAVDQLLLVDALEALGEPQDDASDLAHVFTGDVLSPDEVSQRVVACGHGQTELFLVRAMQHHHMLVETLELLTALDLAAEVLLGAWDVWLDDLEGHSMGLVLACVRLVIVGQHQLAGWRLVHGLRLAEVALDVGSQAQGPLLDARKARIAQRLQG